MWPFRRKPKEPAMPDPFEEEAQPQEQAPQESAAEPVETAEPAGGPVSDDIAAEREVDALIAHMRTLEESLAAAQSSGSPEALAAAQAEAASFRGRLESTSHELTRVLATCRRIRDKSAAARG